MREIYFPSTACVLACSGPSLNKVDVYSLGLPVVAVSTAIRKINKPKFWIIADYLNEMHGEEGKAAYSDPDIIKIVPSDKISHNSNPKSLVLCQYDTATRWPNLSQLLFNGNQPFVRGPHKSVTFGIQWLYYAGVRNVIWTGNDLAAHSMKEKYCYEVKDFDMKKEYNYQKTLDHTSDALKNWYPIALSKGFKWFSWECGENFEKLVPKFDPSKMNFEKNQECSVKITVEDDPEIKKNNKLIHIQKKERNIPKREIISLPSVVEEKKEEPKEVFVPPHLRSNKNPPKEIISERRNHHRISMEIKKNLRSK